MITFISIITKSATWNAKNGGMHYLESNRLVLEVVSRNGEDASLEITIWTLESQRNEI
jgi:hypothetical protein